MIYFFNFSLKTLGYFLNITFIINDFIRDWLISDIHYKFFSCPGFAQILLALGLGIKPGCGFYTPNIQLRRGRSSPGPIIARNPFPFPFLQPGLK